MRMGRRPVSDKAKLELSWLDIGGGKSNNPSMARLVLDMFQN